MQARKTGNQPRRYLKAMQISRVIKVEMRGQGNKRNFVRICTTSGDISTPGQYQRGGGALPSPVIQLICEGGLTDGMNAGCYVFNRKPIIKPSHLPPASRFSAP
jgi:hypothetical protein